MSFPKANYEEIAKTYDLNPVRKEIPLDLDLQDCIENNTLESFKILDLACGTGNYLAVQTQAFSQPFLEWHGLDHSTAMLEMARTKVPYVNYLHSRADTDLPYENESFHFIINTFAFHHFQDKFKALDEIQRVLKPKGVFKLVNICPEMMPKQWIFHYFPETWYVDLKRCWKGELILHELENRGFNVSLSITTDLKRVPLQELYQQALNRDISELCLISDPVYHQGLRRMELELEQSPQQEFLNQFSLLTCVASRDSV